MRDRCVQAVSQAVGRPITQAEAQGIEQRLMRAMRMAASQDPAAFRAMTPDARLQAAAQFVAQDVVQEAVKKKQRVDLTIRAHDRIETWLGDARQAGLDNLNALERTLVFKSDGKSNTLSAESRANAIKANAVRQMIDTFEAVDPRFWGLFESQEGVQMLTRAIFGETQNLPPEVVKGAQAWLDVATQLREQFNASGGKIRELEGWAIPQHHSQLKINKAGVDQWVTDTLPLLDRRRYVKDDGTLMNDQEVADVMRGAWLTLATGGLNKIEPGVQGSGMMANRNAEARSIHFKDADSYLTYQAAYGEKSLWGVMTGHVEAMSKEIAMLETFGPNPNNTFRAFLDRSLQQAAVTDPANAAKHEQQAKRLTALFDFVTGQTQPIVNQRLAETFDTLRNWLVASRLGSAVITALTDEASLHLAAQVNNLPEVQLVRNELAALNPLNKTEENLANRAGLGLDVLLNHLNRWGEDALGPTFSSKMANTVMRASGMEALDGARRRAFGVTMMSALGEMVGKYTSLTRIDPVDNRMLLSKGITETNWQVWRLAELEKWGAGNGVLTPEAIMRISSADLAALVDAERVRIEAEKQAKVDAIDRMATMTLAEKQAAWREWEPVFNERLANIETDLRRDAVLRLLGVTLEETDMAVIRPGAADKFLTGGGMERGTWKGELVRSFFQFKAFPLAMISRHWMRGLSMETTGGKAAYLASLVVATTVLGAVAQSVNDLLQGKDIRNYNPAEEHGVKNWLAAFLKGGSLGLYGDFLFSGATQNNQAGPLAAMLGPVAGLVEEAFKLTQGNVVQAMQGKETHFGAELTRFIKGNTPGASLWYAKAALDHLIFHQLQEYFSPGYLAQMQRRAQKDFGQTYWWQPGAGIEGMRPPDLGRAVGQ